jgi:uncharacterized integral membrane protein (TIGR00698 family)
VPVALVKRFADRFVQVAQLQRYGRLAAVQRCGCAGHAALLRDACKADQVVGFEGHACSIRNCYDSHCCAHLTDKWLWPYHCQVNDQVHVLTPGRRWEGSSSLVPGLFLAALLCGAAFLLAPLPGLRLAGTLGLALFLGVGWRITLGLPAVAVPGVRFTARTQLRLGIVLLGVRLDFGLLLSAGPLVLLLDLLTITTGLLATLALGRLLRLPRGLRLVLAVGTAICGASAIAAAAPLAGADEDEVSQAVGVISLLGALGVIGFTILGPLLQLGDVHYGLLTGATLQEVGHVLAAGAAAGSDALDLATITKLTRVALLAPVLLLLSGLACRGAAGQASSQASSQASGQASGQEPLRAPLLPGFLLGFLLVGAANSAGLIPAGLGASLQLGSVVLTAAAMAAIGLGVDPLVLRRSGARTALVAALGFLALASVAAAYVWLAFPAG